MSWVQDRIIWNLAEPLGQAMVHRLRIPTRQVGAPAPFEEESVSSDQAAPSQEALASWRVARGVDQLYVQPAYRDLVAVSVWHEVAFLHARRTLQPPQLFPIDVHRHVRLLEQLRNSLDRDPCQVAANMVRMMMGDEYPRYRHGVLGKSRENVVDLVGRIHYKRGPGHGVANQVAEVHHLGSQRVTNSEVPAGQQLAKVCSVFALVRAHTSTLDGSSRSVPATAVIARSPRCRRAVVGSECRGQPTSRKDGPVEPDERPGELQDPGELQGSSSVDDELHAEAASFTGDDTSVAPAGRFRIYLGSAAGVGKTCAMLDEGYRRHRRGTDVVIGIVNTHGREHTAAQIRDLELVPPKVVDYRGSVFEEMDIDAVLQRSPEVALVDELAHTNVPGSGRNAKRWQDVTELLDAGISVITTVNIQHVESLADAVERMTHTKVRERVPDWVVRKANQVELIDSSPEQLRRRMLHGNIYPKDKVAVALANFFRRENLIALRELALRFMADETEEEMMEFLRRHGAVDLWETTERILVGVTGAEGTDMVLHRAARIAARSKAELHVVHISPADATVTGNSDVIGKLRTLAKDLGASWHEIDSPDPAGALVHFAVEHQITQIVLGASRRSRLEELVKGSVVNKIMRSAAASGVDVHVIARREREDA